MSSPNSRAAASFPSEIDFAMFVDFNLLDWNDDDEEDDNDDYDHGDDNDDFCLSTPISLVAASLPQWDGFCDVWLLCCGLSWKSWHRIWCGYHYNLT